MAKWMLTLLSALIAFFSVACQPSTVEVTRIVYGTEENTVASVTEEPEIEFADVTPTRKEYVPEQEPFPEEPEVLPTVNPATAEPAVSTLPGSSADTPKIRIEDGSGYSSYWDEYGLTKLHGVALDSGIKLEGEGPYQGFRGILAFSGSVAGEPSLGPGTLIDIVEFVRAGGRAVIFIMPESWSNEFNSTLGDLFSLAVARERIAMGDGLIFDGGELLPLWEGLTVGAVRPEGWVSAVPYLFSYLSGRVEQGPTTTIASEESGRSRVSSILLEIGRGELLLAQATGMNDISAFEGFFLADQQIDRLDNEEAGRRLLEWLVDQQSAPSGAARNMPSDADIARVQYISDQAYRGELTRAEARLALANLAIDVGRQGMALLLRYIPVYDDEGERWVLFDDYAREIAGDLGGEPNSTSRFEADPVGTAVDIMFDDYDSDDILGWLGLDN
jgi:hypothetical protein